MTPTTVTIRRPVTFLLLLLVTAAIIALTVWMTGRSYAKVDPIPFEEIRHLARILRGRQISTQLLAVIVVPMIANVLLFVPWGFLMFISLYTEPRPTVQTYVLTILLGFSLTVAIEGWQYFLPSRVADVNDVIWNTAGTVAGAILGHMRLRVRFEFE
ncbi:MAG TPA: VanZ family protein [Thermoanaerobaculia bacterium]|nr:VanZ family protein [Thermoanaerobaculia bacterium]